MLEVHPTTGIVHAGEDKKKDSNKARVVVSGGGDKGACGDVLRVRTPSAFGIGSLLFLRSSSSSTLPSPFLPTSLTLPTFLPSTTRPPPPPSENVP